MRPLNTAVTFISISAACIIAGAGWSDIYLVLLAATAGSLIGAAGNTINDIFDIAIDRVNKPGRALASALVSAPSATISAVVAAMMGILLSIPLGTTSLLIAMGTVILLYAYSAWLQHIPLAGNVVVAFLTGLAFFYGAAVFGNPAAGIIPALFAFAFNLAREILKDIEDMHGDSLLNVSTFPIVAGTRAALLLVSFILVTIILGSVLPYFLSLYSEAYLWVVIFGVDSLLLFVLFAMWNDRSTGNIARLTLLLKYDMPIGVIAIVLGTR
ncbi:MAG: geranylgeranylglycerol-phosphate geranylgeranyltransferase [Bacteroidetes bacterium]|nr:geranylgeranylglycerol-phosphate geranylgeranyltransferase [Bacteroidota bacterium]